METNITTINHLVQNEWSHIIKSENDNRLYKMLLLNNYMKVILISDPTTDKAAAALNVNIGSLTEPKNLPGLTHLLQHVLYLLKTENSPQQKFKEFVSQNNGVVTTETTENLSTYRFDIAVTKFKNALTSFAQLFINSVVFTPDMIKSELQEINVCNCVRKIDRWGILQLFKSTIDCDYQILNEESNNFEKVSSIPNIPEPISNNIVKYMQKFYDNYYSSHMMSLCILSNESLEQLQVWVASLFSQVKLNKFAKMKKGMSLIQCFPKCESVYKIYGIHTCFYTDYKILYIILPSEYLIHRQYVSFLTYLFEYGGKGSLMSVLRANGWGNDIDTGNLCDAKEFTFFNVAINLTDEGLEHIDDIMTLFFQYVKLLKESNGTEYRRIFNEYKEIKELKFRFKNRESPLEYVTIISRLLLDTKYENMTDILHQIPTYEQFWIQQILKDFLSQQHMRIYIIAEKFKNFAEFSENIGTFKYRKEKVPAKICAKWISNASAELNLPACNEFLPATVSMKSEGYKKSENPTVLWDTQLLRMWYKKDDIFKEPKTIIIFHFICPPVYVDSVSANLTHFFVRLVNNSLREHLYPAILVNSHWQLSATKYGILHEQFCKMQLEQLGKDQLINYSSIQLDNYLLPINEILEKNSHYNFENRFRLLYEKDSCIVGVMFYSVNSRSTELDVMLDFVQQVICKRLAILKSEEQLGCLSYSDIYRTNRIQRLKILAQGLKSQTVEDIKHQINLFMNSVVF
ncbi:Insulin-degrading enzyme [Camponotus floridanus]|uniref:Insulin-degrading enzyme n=1 Tax=Camponotus floridanus TaxID=104421 RepID=E2A6U8_CAMFO|nr:Insulin-degrading enzyme [Camponotus floridanus]